MNLQFVVPGYSKCGTTSLCSMLGDHPDVFVPEGRKKEPAYFAYQYEKGWEWYEKYFKPAAEGQICGEGSTFYTSMEYAELSCQRIQEVFPDLKFIFIARHPIKRLESSYREMHHSGWKYNVNAAYDIGDCIRGLPNMIEDTKFQTIMSIYLKYFPRENIHTMFLEDLKSNPQEELGKCFNFLGVPPYEVNLERAKQLNPASAKLHDSRIYRFIKTHPNLLQRYNSLSPEWSEYIFEKLQFRRPFKSKVKWNQKDLEWVTDQIKDDCNAYLEFCGEPLSRWDLGGEAKASTHVDTQQLEKRAA